MQRHVHKHRKIVDSHKHAEQGELIDALNPVIIGWTHDDAHVMSARVFQGLGNMLDMMLCAWAVSRHPNQKKTLAHEPVLESRRGARLDLPAPQRRPPTVPPRAHADPEARESTRLA
jgi:hypothetical protein